MDLPDAELMLQFKKRRDKNAMTELVRRHQKALVNFFYRLMWDQHAAEDLTQEVFIRLVTAAKDYTPRAKFTTFLYQVARNLWIDKLRKGEVGSRPISLDAPIDPDENTGLSELIAGQSPDAVQRVINHELMARVKKIISSLPEEQQMVLNLTYYQGMSYAETAEVLDIPVGTVKSRLHTAIMKLKEMV